MLKKQTIVTKLPVSDKFSRNCLNESLKQGFHFSLSEIGEYCKFDNNCIGDNTLCKYGKCTCPYETHPNSDRTVCLKDIMLGEKCLEHDECVAEDSKCHDVCRCKTSHIISADGKECFPSKDILN